MRKEETLWIGAFMIILVLLAFPQGFAKSQHRNNGAGPAQGTAHMAVMDMYAASNPSGSCRSLGLNGDIIGYAQLIHGSVLVTVQRGQASTTYNVTVLKLGNGESDNSWVCGTSSQSVGSITTNLLGQGQLYVSYSASHGKQYVVELLDSQGHVLYASKVITA